MNCALAPEPRKGDRFAIVVLDAILRAWRIAGNGSRAMLHVVVERHDLDVCPARSLRTLRFGTINADYCRTWWTTVSKQTTYERLKSSCRRWHGDMTDIADQR